MNTPSPYLKLPLSFDIARLRGELAGIEASHWIGHFNTSAYDKNWSCIPLRSVDGQLRHIMPLENANYQDTPILQQCPYLRHVLAQFACEKTSVRLMSLEAGAVIREHRDEGSSLDDGIARLHIPIQTSGQVLFRIDGQEVHFSAGDTWYLNASCLHAVHNNSPRDRVHLMLDCIANPWLEELFAAAGGVRRAPHPYGDPAIDDGNVLQVMQSLRAGGHEVGARLADQLDAIHARRTSTATGR